MFSSVALAYGFLVKHFYFLCDDAFITFRDARNWALRTTPHLDVLAREAAVFLQAVSPATWTVPSHASLFTGRPVAEHGATAANQWISDDWVTLPERFREAGYDTWAFSANPFVSVTTNRLQGFDVAEHPWDDRWEEKSIQATKEKRIAEDASTEISPRRKPGTGPEKLTNRSELKYMLKDAGPIAKEAFERWIETRDGDRPFFAFVNYMEAHIPRIPTMEARRRVMSEERLKRSLELDPSHINLLQYTVGRFHYTHEDLEVMRSVYDASLVDLDATTHALLESLRERGLLDHTIVALTSDHGDALGDHHVIGHKYIIYNELIRVPLLLWYPPTVKPARVETAVSVLSLAPTLLPLAGLEIRDPKAAPSLFDRSDPAAPQISELRVSTPRALKRVSRIHPDFDWKPWLRTFTSVELDGWKYIRASDGSEELYNLHVDPGEENDRSIEEPKRAAAMAAQIDLWEMARDPFDPTRSPTPPEQNFGPKIRAQLEALGYVSDEDENAPDS